MSQFTLTPDNFIWSSGVPAQRPVEHNGMRGTELASSGPLGAGYRAFTQNMQAPTQMDGGRWMFVGQNNSPGGPGAAGSSDGWGTLTDYEWEWVPDAAPQAQAAPAPQQAPQEMVQPQLDIYDDWDAYRNRARAQTEGLNRMPHVFGQGSEYIPTDPRSAYEMFYPGNLQGWQNSLRNPLLESGTPPMSMTDTGVSAPGANNPHITSPWTNPIFR